MKVEQTRLEGVRLITPDVFEDHRGIYVEAYSRAKYRAHGIDLDFVEDDYSISSQLVLRGIHSDRSAWKLVSCPLGRFYLVVVCCDQCRADFGRWEAFTLSDSNRQQVLIPPQHGVAHLALADQVIFNYKQTENYDPARQSTFRWDDPRFAIWWPIRHPVLSRRDDGGGEGGSAPLPATP